MALEADVAALSAGAATFDRISGDLTQVRAHVEQVAASAKANMDSPQAGVALQAALTRYQEAADQQTRLLSDISHNIQQSGVQYDTTDMDNSSSLTQAMNSALNT
jgi:hypothetical protein